MRTGDLTQTFPVRGIKTQKSRRGSRRSFHLTKDLGERDAGVKRSFKKDRRGISRNSPSRTQNLDLEQSRVGDEGPLVGKRAACLKKNSALEIHQRPEYAGAGKWDWEKDRKQTVTKISR